MNISQRNVNKLIKAGVVLLSGVCVLAGVWFLQQSFVIAQVNTDNQNDDLKPPYKAHSLIGASSAELAQVVITLSRMSHVLSPNSTPVVLFARQVTIEELKAFKLAGMATNLEDKPIALVIMKGDFGPIDPAKPEKRMRYQADLLDLEKGYSVSAMQSPNGEGLREALNDPTLPETQHPINLPDESVKRFLDWRAKEIQREQQELQRQGTSLPSQ